MHGVYRLHIDKLDCRPFVTCRALIPYAFAHVCHLSAGKCDVFRQRHGTHSPRFAVLLSLSGKVVGFKLRHLVYPFLTPHSAFGLSHTVVHWQAW
jgi:hypothetical protein